MLRHELAKQTNVNLETLRFYEQKGLLPAPKRNAAGYRQYNASDVRLVCFIKRAQVLGFSLAEISGLLKLSNHRPGNCSAVQTLSQQKLTEVQAKIKDLQAVQAALQTLLNGCQASQHKTECPLLASVA